MTGVYSFAVVPIQMETVTSFSANDPWNGNRGALMTLSVYRMVNERATKLFATLSAKAQQQAVSGKALKTSEVLGLRSSLDGRYHMVPITIARLWQKDRLRTEDLPRIVAEVERGMPTSDYFSTRLNPMMKAVVWIFVGLGGLLLAAAAIAWLAGPARSHLVRQMPVTQWLSHSQHEASLELSGRLPIDGYIHIGQIPVTAGIADSAYDADLGWYHASDGERLILLESESMGPGDHDTIFKGSVIPLREVAVSPGAIATVSAKVPGLRTDLIACSYWRWEDGYGTPGWSWWLVPGIFSLILAGFLQSLFILRERKLRVQEARFAERFAGASNS